MLIRLPDSWPHGLIAVLAMLVLAMLDLGGAFAAKEAVLRRSMPMAALGVALFVMLFWVYASSLRYADLAPVTLGWVVVLQIGVVLLDRFRYQTPISRGQWAAVVVVIAAQAYLLLGGSSAVQPAPAPAPAEARADATAPTSGAPDTVPIMITLPAPAPDSPLLPRRDHGIPIDHGRPIDHAIRTARDGGGAL